MFPFVCGVITFNVFDLSFLLFFVFSEQSRQDNLELLLDVTYQEPGEISLVVSSADCSVVVVARQGNMSPPADLPGSGSVSSTSPTFLTRLADLRSESVSPEPSCIGSARGDPPNDPVSAGDDPGAGMSG